MNRTLVRVGVGLGAALTLAAAGLAVQRKRRERAAGGLWDSLASPGGGQRFTPQMTEGLPEPARRYLLHAIAPGTPLAASVRLGMRGSIRLDPRGEPLPMTSEEVLAPPHGYVWKARVGKGMLRFGGFDAYAEGAAEMRWWMAGIIPIVRARGHDLARAAEGRLLGEAVFLPSVLLPSAGARWEAVDDSTARVRLRSAIEEVVLTLEVDSDGALRRASFPRWNVEPSNGPVGYVEFATDELSDERTFGGYTIPTRFRSGWRLGSEGEFPFFFAAITSAEYR
jgi:hypothetical protein